MTNKENLEKIGHILYFEATICDKQERVFVDEYDSVEEAEDRKAEINRGKGNIDMIVGVAHHYVCHENTDNDYIVIKPKLNNDAEHFKYTDMISVNDVVQVCEAIIDEAECV